MRDVLALPRWALHQGPLAAPREAGEAEDGLALAKGAHHLDERALPPVHHREIGGVRGETLLRTVGGMGAAPDHGQPGTGGAGGARDSQGVHDRRSRAHGHAETEGFPSELRHAGFGGEIEPAVDQHHGLTGERGAQVQEAEGQNVVVVARLVEDDGTVDLHRVTAVRPPAP